MVLAGVRVGPDTPPQLGTDIEVAIAIHVRQRRLTEGVRLDVTVAFVGRALLPVANHQTGRSARPTAVAQQLFLG